MKNFISYINNGGSAGEMLTSEDLDGVLKSYPWFMTARLIRNMRTGKPDPETSLHLSVYPAMKQMLEKVNEDDFKTRSSEQIIEEFLHNDEPQKIVPLQDTPEHNPETSNVAAMSYAASEELADIYIKQGLLTHATEVYAKLILLYPKKSVYFAEIIEKLHSRIEEQGKKR